MEGAYDFNGNRQSDHQAVKTPTHLIAIIYFVIGSAL
jgi:hypothetical protein